MERTLTIIKPDAVQRNLAGKILSRLEAEGFVILGLKMVKLSKLQNGFIMYTMSGLFLIA